MYVLKVKGARNSTLAYHYIDSEADLRELMAIYESLGYSREALIVEERSADRAA